MEGKVEVGLLGKQLIHQLWKRRITNMLWWTCDATNKHMNAQTHASVHL